MKKLIFIIGIIFTLIGCEKEVLNEDVAVVERQSEVVLPSDEEAQESSDSLEIESEVTIWEDGVNIVFQEDLSNPFVDRFPEGENRQYRDIVLEQIGILSEKTGVEYNIYVNQEWLNLDWIVDAGITAEDYPILDSYGTSINYFEGNADITDYSLLQWTISSTFSSSVGNEGGKHYSGVSGADIRDNRFKIQNVAMEIAGVKSEDIDTPPTEEELDELRDLYSNQ